jgi:hypothetical protein
MTAVLPTQPFTAVNIGSVTIATSAIIVVTNTLYMLFALPKKWVAFSLAIIIAYMNVIFMQSPQWYDWLLAFLNACLLFCSALGMNQIVSTKAITRDAGTGRRFFERW